MNAIREIHCFHSEELHLTLGADCSGTVVLRLVAAGVLSQPLVLALKILSAEPSGNWAAGGGSSPQDASQTGQGEEGKSVTESYRGFFFPPFDDFSLLPSLSLISQASSIPQRFMFLKNKNGCQ